MLLELKCVLIFSGYLTPDDSEPIENEAAFKYMADAEFPPPEVDITSLITALEVLYIPVLIVLLITPV